MSGKSDVYVLAAAATHRNTFVGGTCAPPSALLV